MIPLFGLTQYCLGAVVLTLKPTGVLVGFLRVSLVVTTSLNGPAKKGQTSRWWERGERGKGKRQQEIEMESKICINNMKPVYTLTQTM